MVPLAGGTAGVRAVCTPRQGMSPVRHIGQNPLNDTVPSVAAASLSGRDSALVVQKGKASEMSGLAAGHGQMPGLQGRAPASRPWRPRLWMEAAGEPAWQQ